jgi:hypothetical protein
MTTRHHRASRLAQLLAERTNPRCPVATVDLQVLDPKVDPIGCSWFLCDGRT